ncbi:serine/threonine protein kinase [Mucilaginibacter mali]|uniref:Serine/threonine protein kinase n=1 Tax=Mucilaginibacter mali TaxID=2740462 RepID=A0A7D4QRF5_9SPHI|nr:serine/threonine-protein kinase [Mucilaginibacter mali]QKJ29549.1 serine/threonine protein kinase [Mucilaginibacter mali]
MSKVFTIMEGLENMGAIRTGGQGSVYKARRMGPILSAVKLLPTPIFTEDTDDKNYRRFLNEVEKLKRVNQSPDPYVVKILSSGITESGSLPFIEMEYIEGPDLCELLTEPQSKVFTIQEVVKVADHLSRALAHCHKVGVKHGDVKSNNVKYNINNGNYVLLDFGLSIMSDEERRSSLRHAGAIEFMAPEQNDGEMLFQTDVYSYGVVLYEMLAGQVPFPLAGNGETARNTVMLAHMEVPVPDVLEIRKQNLPKNWTADQKEREMQVPAWLLNLVYKCLEKIPDNRYGNGMDLHDAVASNGVVAAADSYTDTLKAQNQDLQNQLTQLRDAEVATQRSSIIVSKPIAMAAVGLMVILLIFGIYSHSSKEVVYYPAPKTSNYIPLVLQKPYTPPKPVVHTVKPTDSIEKAHAKTPAQVKPKHKRKKFLGIF